MKPKLFFWIDSAYAHFGLAKYIHDNFKCELFSIFDVTDEPKKFFQSQKLVKFTKIWFYYDHILKTKYYTNDGALLKELEKKLSIYFICQQIFLKEKEGLFLVPLIASLLHGKLQKEPMKKELNLY